jgi:eukaryotic-like serine/threonine-protein kinase
MSDRPQLQGFEILRQLGEGGAARVYLARQHSLDRHVAIKCLRQDRIDDDALARLSLEATTLAKLTYPGIVAVHDVITEDAGVFMVMEYLPGGSLRDHLKTPMSLRQALLITVQLARALEHAHDHGLVHRDLKPENVLFRENDTPVITDFGIVFHLDTRQSQRLTERGTIIGTPTYLSPEQISGKRASAQSDLYSLGVMLYEMLSGKPPFQGETTNAIIYGHLSQAPPPLPEPFSPLQPVLDNLLAKEPEERFGSAQGFLEALKETLRANVTLLDEAVNQPSLSVPERLHALGLTTGENQTTQPMDARRSPKRSRGWLSVAVVVAGVLVIGGFSVHLGLDRLPGIPSDTVANGDSSDEVTSPPEPTIAVLPFADMSPDRDQEYFADGLAEELLNLLAGVEELQVTARTSSFAFRGREVSIPEIGQTLGVGHILQGSVRKSGDRLRITAQLIDTATGFYVWSETYNRVPEDVFKVQDEIADSIARALQVTLTAGAVGTESLEAYDLYLRARGLIHSRDPDKLRQARRLLDRALSLDPDYAPALAASGELWLHLSDRVSAYGDVPVAEADEAARRDLERALELNSDLAEVHAALGLLATLNNDTESAKVHLSEALGKNPSLAGANNWKAGMLQRKGKASEALAIRQRSVDLDPLFPVNRSNLAFAQRFVGDYVAAEQTGRELQDEFPESHFGWMSMISVLFDQGRLADAVDSSRRALELEPDRVLNRLYSEALYYRLADYEQVLEVSVGYYESRALIALGRVEEGLDRAFRRLGEPGHIAAVFGLMEGLALIGRYQELLDLATQGGEADAAMLEQLISKTTMVGDALAPLAIAQYGLGLEDELAETLAVWRESLADMDKHGNASTPFRFAQARYHAIAGERSTALARLAEAIDMGYRDPLLIRAPAFVRFHDDPEFVALAERMVDLINAERAELDMPPL